MIAERMLSEESVRDDARPLEDDVGSRVVADENEDKFFNKTMLWPK